MLSRSQREKTRMSVHCKRAHEGLRDLHCIGALCCKTRINRHIRHIQQATPAGRAAGRGGRGGENPSCPISATTPSPSWPPSSPNGSSLRNIAAAQCHKSQAGKRSRAASRESRCPAAGQRYLRLAARVLFVFSAAFASFSGILVCAAGCWEHRSGATRRQRGRRGDGTACCHLRS